MSDLSPTDKLDEQLVELYATASAAHFKECHGCGGGAHKAGLRAIYASSSTVATHDEIALMAVAIHSSAADALQRGSPQHAKALTKAAHLLESMPPSATTFASEIERLKAIEHAAWHALEACEERDDCLVIPLEVGKELSALLPEAHP